MIVDAEGQPRRILTRSYLRPCPYFADAVFELGELTGAALPAGTPPPLMLHPVPAAVRTHSAAGGAAYASDASGSAYAGSPQSSYRAIDYVYGGAVRGRRSVSVLAFTMSLAALIAWNSPSAFDNPHTFLVFAVMGTGQTFARTLWRTARVRAGGVSYGFRWSQRGRPSRIEVHHTPRTSTAYLRQRGVMMPTPIEGLWTARVVRMTTNDRAAFELEVARFASAAGMAAPVIASRDEPTHSSTTGSPDLGPI